MYSRLLLKGFPPNFPLLLANSMTRNDAVHGVLYFSKLLFVDLL